MPLISSERYPIVLDSCVNDPPSKRAEFICRGLTAQEQMDVARVADDLDTSKAQDVETNANALFGVLETCVVDWRNVIGPDGKSMRFSPENIRRVLSFREADELLTKVMQMQIPSADEKKTSGSLSRGSKAKSRKTRQKRSR